jgi:hypothetical protein
MIKGTGRGPARIVVKGATAPADIDQLRPGHRTVQAEPENFEGWRGHQWGRQ